MGAVMGSNMGVFLTLALPLGRGPFVGLGPLFLGSMGLMGAECKGGTGQDHHQRTQQAQTSISYDLVDLLQGDHFDEVRRSHFLSHACAQGRFAPDPYDSLHWR